MVYPDKANFYALDTGQTGEIVFDLGCDVYVTSIGIKNAKNVDWNKYVFLPGCITWSFIVGEVTCYSDLKSSHPTQADKDRRFYAVYVQREDL